MKPELILQADILDIVFEGRNKEYGAYDLRKHYGVRMSKAMAGVFLLVCATFGVAFLPSSRDEICTKGQIIPPDVFLEPVNIPKEEQPGPKIPPVKQATIQHATPLIVQDDVDEPVPEISQLTRDIAIGTENIEGPPATTVPAPLAPSADEGGNKPVEEIVDGREKILQSSEVMPEFPGGQAAFIRFLSRNLRVPDDQLEEGQRLKVIVRFVVGKDGELSNLVFLQSGGEAFEREVLRVMKKMPKWKPGSQNGENVAVYFNLPIIFDNAEE